MKYTRELLQEILDEGDAVVLEEYERYNQRMYVRFRCSCGEETSKRFEMLNKYRYPYCETCSLKKKAKKCEKTCLQKYGVKNAAMTKEVKEKIQEVFEKKFGGHPKQTEEVQKKWVQTCLEKYGGHPNQNTEVQEKSEKTSYAYREYMMPSGKVVKIQGFEDVALDELLMTHEEEDIICGRGNVPSIPYFINEKKHVYFPDFYIKSSNTILEIKSEWTIKQPRAYVKEKGEGTLNAGYNFEVWLYNGKKEKINVDRYEKESKANIGITLASGGS